MSFSIVIASALSSSVRHVSPDGIRSELRDRRDHTERTGTERNRTNSNGSHTQYYALYFIAFHLLFIKYEFDLILRSRLRFSMSIEQHSFSIGKHLKSE